MGTVRNPSPESQIWAILPLVCVKHERTKNVDLGFFGKCFVERDRECELETIACENKVKRCGTVGNYLGGRSKSALILTK